MRASVLRQVGEPEEIGKPDLDRLDDSEVDHLYHATLRKIATESRRGSM